MYLLTWNTDSQRIEATFGGPIWKEEMQHFSSEFRKLLKSHSPEGFSVLLDYGTTSRFDGDVLAQLQTLRDECAGSGASVVIIVARNEPEAQALAALRVAQVTAGREEYLSFGLAA